MVKRGIAFSVKMYEKTALTAASATVRPIRHYRWRFRRRSMMTIFLFSSTVYKNLSVML